MSTKPSGPSLNAVDVDSRHCAQGGPAGTEKCSGCGKGLPVHSPYEVLLIFSLVHWGWWVEGQAGVGEEGPGQSRVVVDPADALFGGVGDIGEVVAGEVGEFAFLE
ncbi:hypothetical protein ABZY16_00075 [Streptomyces sp. NPDC006553]|uniref:hypothetical protein n=1 Tax=Streptomyces sp. NPDC006553 TaxID=3157180 RepID=UPI0033AAE555